MNNEYYKFVADEQELEWFFNHAIVKPELDESYLMCLSARNKKLDEEERKLYNLGRSEMMREEIIAPRSKSKLWNFNIFKSSIYRYECRKEGIVTKNGLPYPDKCLVVYFYPNPSKESLVITDSVKLAITMMSEMINASAKKSWNGVEDGLDKLGTISKHIKSSHAANLSRKLYVQFDFDIIKDNDIAFRRKEAYNIIHADAINHFDKGNFFIIETAGGFHVLVKKESYGKSMEKANKKKKENNLNYMPDFLSDVVDNYSYTFEEAIKCNQEFIPLPGTYQYSSFIVRVLNKEDFNE